MFKFLKDRKEKDNKGFTLVELVIVVAILAILVGILAPQYTKYVEKSRKSADAANMDEMVKAVEVYAADGINKPVAGSASITIGNNSTTVASVSGKTDSTSMVTAALSEHVKDYANIKMKSNDWGGDSISAEITVEADGAVTVVYSPDKFKEYMGQKAPDNTKKNGE